MTENEIKEMLKDIIDNDAEYECRSICECEYKRENCDDTCPWTDRLWNKYHLGDEIHDDWEYREIITYYIFKDAENEYCTDETYPAGTNIYFKGTKEECEKWVKENSKKTWLEERKSCLSVSFGKKEINLYEAGAKEICKKILEELPKYLSEGLYCELVGNLRLVFKDLGVEV